MIQKATTEIAPSCSLYFSMGCGTKHTIGLVLLTQMCILLCPTSDDLLFGSAWTQRMCIGLATHTQHHYLKRASLWSHSQAVAPAWLQLSASRQNFPAGILIME